MDGCIVYTVTKASRKLRTGCNQIYVTMTLIDTVATCHSSVNLYRNTYTVIITAGVCTFAHFLIKETNVTYGLVISTAYFAQKKMNLVALSCS